MNAPATELVRYDAMCRAIDQAFEVDEVKDIHDKALALELYLRQAGNTEAERRACEIRLRSERKAGRLLAEIDKQPGRKTSPHDGGRFQNVIRNNGISDKQAERWQQLAAVPEDQFEAALADPEKPTTNGIIARAKPSTGKPMDKRALWIWGRLREFERDRLLDADPQELLDEMTDAMRADAVRLAPLVAGWIERMSDG